MCTKVQQWPQIAAWTSDTGGRFCAVLDNGESIVDALISYVPTLLLRPCRGTSTN